MTKGISAEGSRAVAWMLEDVLALGAKRLDSLKRNV